MENLFIEKNDKGHSIFRNPNTKMVEEIKKITLDDDTFDYLSHKNCIMSQKLNEKQCLCMCDKDIYFIISTDQYSTLLHDKLISIINEKFNVVEILNEYFCPIYSDFMTIIGFKKMDKNNFIIKYPLETIIEGLKYSLEYDRIILSEYKDEEYYECWLNEDGNIVVSNRFNTKLENTSKQKTKEDLLSDLLQFIPDIKYKNYANMWYADEFTFDLDDNETIFKIVRHQRYNPPKTSIDVDRKHLISKILLKVQKYDIKGEIDFSEYIIEQIPQKPVLRKQKTKLKKSLYEIFDYSQIEIEENILKALQNIENSIDIDMNDEIVKEWLEEELQYDGLPSFSFNKGEIQENHSKYIGLVTLPHGCNYTFKVAEGDASEISWSHSIYHTDIIDLELVV